jgi:hypothetical protein
LHGERQDECQNGSATNQACSEKRAQIKIWFLGGDAPNGIQFSEGITDCYCSKPEKGAIHWGVIDANGAMRDRFKRFSVISE